MSAIEYLDELDALAVGTDWGSRVQIACAQAIVEAIREQTAVIKESLETRPKLTALWHPSGVDIEEQAERLSKAEGALREVLSTANDHAREVVSRYFADTSPTQWLPSGADMADRFGGDE